MLSSIAKTLTSRRERRRAPQAVSEDDELVIETKAHSLCGVVGDYGPSGTAIAGCGSAWMRGFNMEQNLAGAHLEKVASASINKTLRANSANSLELDEDLFGGCDAATSASEAEERDEEVGEVDSDHALETSATQSPEDASGVDDDGEDCVQHKEDKAQDRNDRDTVSQGDCEESDRLQE